MPRILRYCIRATNNTIFSAFSASLRDYICFFLSQRREGRQELRCIFCSYLTHLCVLCALARNFMFFSRGGAEAARNFDVCFVLAPNTFAYFAPWRENLFFLSQRRQDRQELQCLFCSYPKYLCVLCALARKFVFFLSLRRRGRRELRCIFCSYLTHLCVLCALARNFMFFSRKGAKTVRNFYVCFVLAPNTSACSASLRDYICFFLSLRRSGRREYLQVRGTSNEGQGKTKTIFTLLLLRES